MSANTTAIMVAMIRATINNVLVLVVIKLCIYIISIKTITVNH